MPAQQFAGVAVDDQRQRGPAALSCPHPTHVRRPALIRPCRDRRDCLDPRTHSDRTLANLPALELKYPLDRVLVEPGKPGHGPVADSSCSIIALMGSATRGSTFGTALVALQLTARCGSPSQAQSLVRGTLMPSARRPCWILDHLSSASSGRAWYFFARATPAWPLHRPPEDPSVAFRIGRECRAVWRAGNFPSRVWRPRPSPRSPKDDRSNDRLASATVV